MKNVGPAFVKLAPTAEFALLFMLRVSMQFSAKAVNECALIARPCCGTPWCSSTPACLRRDEKIALMLTTLRLGRPPPCFPPTVPPRPSLLPPTVHRTVEDVGADDRY